MGGINQLTRLGGTGAHMTSAVNTPLPNFSINPALKALPSQSIVKGITLHYPAGQLHEGFFSHPSRMFHAGGAGHFPL